MSSGFALKNGALFLSTEAQGGIYNAEQLRKVAQISEETSMIVKVTEDQRLGIVVTKDQLAKVKQDLLDVGLEVRNYQEGLHQPTSCLGKMCSEHQQDALKSSLQITEALKGLSVSTPIKIGLNGCGRCCNPTHTLDVSIVGSEAGYRIALGGKSAMIPEMGQLVADSVPAENLPVLMRSVVETYVTFADPSDSMAEVIDRVGLAPFAKVLAPWSQDAGVGEDFSQNLSSHGAPMDSPLKHEIPQDLNADSSLATDELSDLGFEEGELLDATLEESVAVGEESLETADALTTHLENPNLSAELPADALDSIELDGEDLDATVSRSQAISDSKSSEVDLSDLGDIELSGFDGAELESEISADLAFESHDHEGSSKLTLDESEDVAIDLDGLASMESLDIPIHEMPELDLDEGMESKVDKVSDSSEQDPLGEDLLVADAELSMADQDLETLGQEVSFEADDALSDTLREVSELDQELEQMNSDFEENIIVESEEQVAAVSQPSMDVAPAVKKDDLSELDHLGGIEATDADVDEIEKKLDAEVGEQLGFQHLSEDKNELDRMETLSLLEDDNLDNSSQVPLALDQEEILDRDSTALEELAFETSELAMASDEETLSYDQVALSCDQAELPSDQAELPSDQAGLPSDERATVEIPELSHSHETTENSPSLESNVKPIRPPNTSRISLQDMDLSPSGGIYLRFSNGLELELGSEIFDGTKKAMKFAGLTLKIDSTGGHRAIELDGIKFSIPVAAA